MSAEMETLETGGGNTISPPVRIVPSKRWCFTYNNYPDNVLEIMETKFKSFNIEYIVGHEVGEEGTPHLQGYIESPIKIRPIEKLNLPIEIHWEKTKFDRITNVKYCSKDGNFVHSSKLKPPRQVRVIEPAALGEWALEVVRLAEAEPDDRTIHWRWEPVGGIGKTQLCKYLVINHDAIILGGKAADIRNGILDFYNRKKHTPELIVINLARTQEEYVSYEGLENIKDMLFYSGKYEGGMICGPCPTLIVFANFKPDETKLSSDRWDVIELQ